jgi:hypothetical protein
MNLDAWQNATSLGKSSVASAVASSLSSGVAIQRRSPLKQSRSRCSDGSHECAPEDPCSQKAGSKPRPVLFEHRADGLEPRETGPDCINASERRRIRGSAQGSTSAQTIASADECVQDIGLQHCSELGGYTNCETGSIAMRVRDIDRTGRREATEDDAVCFERCENAPSIAERKADRRPRL